MTVGSPSVASPKMAARWAGSSDTSEPSAASESSHETWSEKVYAALPLFIVGSGCLAVAVDFYLSAATAPFAGNSSVRLAPWTLFLALAVTGLSAGVFALIMEDDDEPIPAPSTAAPKPAPEPPWDESTLTPAKSSFAGPRTWERHQLEPEDIASWSPEEPPVERVSPDVVLVQIDEIAASLRKKAPPSQTP